MDRQEAAAVVIGVEQRELLASRFAGAGWQSDALVAAARDAEDFYFDSFAKIQMDSWSTGRVTLVGDAGYFKDPITAHGITDALRDAEILARVIVTEGPDAVGRYQAERDELSRRLFRVTGRIASFDWTADEIGRHLLELGEAMAEGAAAMAADDPGRRLELASA